VARIGFLELGVAGFREPKPLLRALAPAHVGGDGWDEFEIVRVELEDSQQTGEFREIAANDPLQVRHMAESPVLELFRREQVHMDENVDGGNDFPLLQDGSYGAHDPWIELVITVVGDSDNSFPGLDIAGMPTRFLSPFVSHDLFLVCPSDHTGVVRTLPVRLDLLVVAATATRPALAQLAIDSQ
jgi:hypothetical protein